METKRQWEVQARIAMDGNEQELVLAGSQNEAFILQAVAGDVLLKTVSGSSTNYYTILQGSSIGSDQMIIGGQTLYFIGDAPAVLEIILQRIIKV